MLPIPVCCEEVKGSLCKAVKKSIKINAYYIVKNNLFMQYIYLKV